MKKYIKSIIKNIFFYFLRPENKEISKLIDNFNTDLNILDIGATGGIQNKWKLIKNVLNVTLVEPNVTDELKENSFKTLNIIRKIFYSKPNKTQKLFITKYHLCSSLYKPNYSYLSKFKGKTDFFSLDSFEIVKEIDLETTTVDSSFEKKTLDFIKIDAEGSHLDILEGSSKKLDEILGLEIECEFFHIREKNHLYSEVIDYLKKFNFEFIDFLSIIRWERHKFRDTGQPQLADLFFLKNPDSVINDFNSNVISEKILLKYIIILSIYNRSDLLNLVISKVNKDFVKKNRIDKIYKLTEKKVARLNKFLYLKNFFKSIINNEI